MSLYRKFGTNKKSENEGISVDYGDGCVIRVARAGGSNRAYISSMEKVARKFRKQLQLDVLSGADQEKVMREVYAQTIVLGWKGVKGRDGKEIPFSPEACLKLFEDLPDLFRDLQEHATNIALFREDASLEPDAKN